MTYKNLDTLSQLLGCYFHQDWPEEFDSDTSALRAIIDSEPKEQVSAAVQEIDELLDASLPANMLKTILIDKIGCYFDPRTQGITDEQWLKRVRETFAKG